MERAVHHRVMDGVAEFLLVGLADGCGHDHFPLSCLSQKGSQQILFFLGRQMGMMAATVWFVAQNLFALLEVTSLHMTDGTRLPAQRLRDLPGTQAQCRPEPNTLNPLILGLAASLL
jgi:hypothetical protein